MSCKMCLNAHVDPELTSDNDLSYSTIGECTDSYIPSGPTSPLPEPSA